MLFTFVQVCQTESATYDLSSLCRIQANSAVGKHTKSRRQEIKCDERDYDVEQIP